MRVAAIDIGTVTCRLLLADVSGARVVELERRCAITNLGVGVDATGVLRSDAIERVAAQVADYVGVVRSCQGPALPAIPIVAVATSASRDASNASVLVERLRAVGVELSVIAGTREAALSFRGASRGHEGERLMVVDVGGGSTEVVLGRGGMDPVLSRSFDVGCRRLTERFLASDPPTEAQCAAARALVADALAPFFADARAQGLAIDRVVAVAGTATSVVSIDQAMAVYDSERVHGTVVSRATLQGVYDRLRGMAVRERERVTGLEPPRAPVIVAGMGILLEALDASGCAEFTVSESDILQGLVMDAAQR